MNWETLSTLACFWMFLLVAVQYFKRAQKIPYVMGGSYFVILFLSGVISHIPQSAFSIQNSTLSACLRVIASGILLSLVAWFAGNRGRVDREEDAGKPESIDKKRSALLKLPFLIILVAMSLRMYPRVYSVLELVFAIAIFVILKKNAKEQAVRLRLFFKGAILGFIYIVLKVGMPDFAIVQIAALLIKLAAFYYIYCLVSSYLAQSYLCQFHYQGHRSHESI